MNKNPVKIKVIEEEGKDNQEKGDSAKQVIFVKEDAKETTDRIKEKDEEVKENKETEQS